MRRLLRGWEPVVPRKRLLPISGPERVVGGLFIVVKGHPPAGEKLELIGYGFNEAWAVAQAKAHNAYVYQLIYSFR